MELNKELSNAIDNCLNLKGINIELGKTLDDKNIELDTEIKHGNVEQFIRGGYVNNYLFLKTIVRMCKENKIDIVVNETATSNDIDYLARLTENNNYEYK